LLDVNEILKIVRTILLIDWPSKDVPETLTRAGFRIFVHGGPGPEDYSAYELDGRDVVSRPTGCRPNQADLVYSHRPLAELPKTLAEARAVSAKFLWIQSGMSSDGTRDPKGHWMSEDDLKTTHGQVHAAGLELITRPYILDVLREALRA
jgi:predicted CoA-binding protein